LYALKRGVDVACGRAGCSFLTHDVPGFERRTQLNLDALRGEVAVLREAEFQVRREPRGTQWVTRRILFGDDIGKVRCNEVRQHETIVQLGAPACEPRGRVRSTPETRHEGAQQKLLREAHALVGRHFKSAQLEQPQPPRRAIGRIQLVDAEFGAMRIARHVDEQIAE
jgi:hypothetical protein